MHPNVNEVLQDYELACQHLPDENQKFVHEQLCDNLRARFEKEKGTCEGYWYQKAQEQTSNIVLLKKMEHAFESVVRFRAFEVSLKAFQKDLQDDQMYQRAGETCERVVCLQPYSQPQDNLFNHQNILLPAQRMSSLNTIQSNGTASCPVHKVLRRTKSWIRPNRIMPRTKQCTKTNWVLPKARVFGKESLHPPMLCSKSPNTSQQRYANYCQQISAAYQSCPQPDTRISQIDFANLSKSF